MGKQITIYEIAKLTGVSPSTVSRVVNNKPGVCPTVRKKVLACMEEHNYVPNETARGLVNQASRFIGILLSDLRTSHHTDGIFYIQQELEEKGYSCIIMNTGHGEAEKAHYIQLLSKRRVDAAVLIGSTFESPRVAQAIETFLPTTPIVIANGYLNLPNVYGVIADEQGGVTDCVKLLAQKGRKHPAFLVNMQTPSNLLKIEGYKQGLRLYLGEAAPIVRSLGTNMAEIPGKVANLLQEHPEVDALICSEDPIAAYAMRSLRQMHLQIPEQISVIGINNSLIAEITSPALTSLNNMLMDLSITSARTLLDLLNGKRVVKKVMLCSSIVEREST